MNAVGYDVLHTYNLSSCPRRIVPRAVWKRHCTGQDSEHMSVQSGTSSRNRVWENDTMSTGPWNQPKVPSYQTAETLGARQLHKSPVPALRTHRSETSEAKESTGLKYQPYLCHRTPSQQEQHQQQMQELRQQIQKQRRRVNYSYMSRSPEHARVSRDDSTAGSSDPSPAFSLRPVPAPREEKAMKQSAELCKGLPLPNHGQKEIKQGGQLYADSLGNQSNGSHGDKMDGVKKETTSGKDALESSAGDVSHTKAVSPAAHVRQYNRPAEHEVKEASQCLKNKEVEKHHKVDRAHSNETSASEKKNQHTHTDSTKCSRSSRSTTPRNEHEIMELLCHKLFNKDSSLSKNRSASSVLEHFAKSYFIDHRHKAGVPSPLNDTCQAQIIPSPSKNESQPTMRISNTHVCRKRSKTIQNTESKRRPASEATQVRAKSYDSAVLQAIRAEEESKKSDVSSEISMHATGMSSETNDATSYSRKPNKKASAGGESEGSSVHEAGRRLAKLRKRLEDSIQLIQKQPGLDKELLEKARSTKMRRRKDDLETFITKGDTLELSPLGNNESLTNKTIFDPTRNPEPTAKSPFYVKEDTTRQREKQQLSHNESNRTRQGKEVADGEPNNSTRKAQTLPCDGVDNSEAEEKLKESNTGVQDEASRVAESCATTQEVKHDNEHEQASQKKEGTPEQSDISVDGQNLTEHYKRLHPNTFTAKPYKGLLSEQAESKDNKNDGNNITVSPRKAKGDNVRSKSDAVGFLSSSGQLLDEESLDAILERQSKRREDLKQRKRIHNDSTVAEKTGSEDTPVEKNSQDPKQVSEAVCPKVLGEHTKQMSMQQPHNWERNKDTNGKAEDTDAQLSPIIMDGTPFLLTSKSKVTEPDTNKKVKDEETRDSNITSEEHSPSIDMSDFTPYVSKRSLSHLKYEEPEIHVTKNDPTNNNTQSPEKKITGTNVDNTSGPERDSSARRRVRWRRQAERAEKQRMEAGNQKTPPPVPPKITRLNDIVDNSAGTLKTGSICSTIANCQIMVSKDAGENEVTEGKTQPDSTNTSGTDTCTTKLCLSPKLVRGSFICTIRDKNTVLAAGETGLAKGPPINVEICEEKSLTPSKAASVFDPKVQLEKEKEKQEADRALRASNREGMPSPQFKANVRLFEQAAEGAVVRSLSPDSKVKANVKKFEEVSKAQRSQSASPERRRPRRSSCSPSSPLPKLERFARDQ